MRREGEEGHPPAARHVRARPRPDDAPVAPAGGDRRLANLARWRARLRRPPSRRVDGGGVRRPPARRQAFASLPDAPPSRARPVGGARGRTVARPPAHAPHRLPRRPPVARRPPLAGPPPPFRHRRGPPAPPPPPPSPRSPRDPP